MIVRDQWTEMNDFIFIDGDVIQIGDASNIDQRIDPLADAAFQFKNLSRFPPLRCGHVPLVLPMFEVLLPGLVALIYCFHISKSVGTRHCRVPTKNYFPSPVTASDRLL